MFSRKIRSRVPVFPQSLGSFKDHKRVSLKEKERKEKQENRYNKRHGVKKLPNLYTGEKVWIVDMRAYGEIVRVDINPNSYIVKTERGNTVRRNRWHLVPAPYKAETVCNDETLIIPDDMISEYQTAVKDHVDPCAGDRHASEQSTENIPDKLVSLAECDANNHAQANVQESSENCQPSPRKSTRPRKPPNRYSVQ